MPEIGEIRPGAELGYKYWAKWQWCACPDCGVCRWIQLNKARSGKQLRCKPCANRRKSTTQKRAANFGWKGGSHVTPQGYRNVMLTLDDPLAAMAKKSGYVLEHRIVVARRLGRCLLPAEIVHHKNGDRLDNRPENLVLFARNGDHQAEHSRGYQEGYAQGLTDGWSTQIMQLRERLAELERQLKGEKP